jgi:hypothetical protein
MARKVSVDFPIVKQKFQNVTYTYFAHRRYPYFDVVVGSNDPESYAGYRVATGRVSLAGQVKGDDPD